MLLFFHVGFDEDVCVEGSPLVNHIENNLKRSMVLMKVILMQFDPKKLVIFYYIIL
jgi:hypothetical protein